MVYATAGHVDSANDSRMDNVNRARNWYLCGDDTRRHRRAASQDHFLYGSIWAGGRFFDSSGGLVNAADFYFNGTSGAASGDTYVTLTQSVSEYAPAEAVPRYGFVDFSDPGVL